MYNSHLFLAMNAPESHSDFPFSVHSLCYNYLRQILLQEHYYDDQIILVRNLFTLSSLP